MARPCVYLDYAFFKHLKIKINESVSNLYLYHNGEEDKNIPISMFKFLIHSEADIVLHANYNELIEHDLIRVLQDQHTQGKRRLMVLSKELFDNELNGIGQRSPFSICFLAHPEKRVEELISNSGFTCISEKNFDEFTQNHYIKKNAFEVAKDGDISGWHDFGKLSHTFNTILIFDRYLFKPQYKNSSRSEYKETLTGIVTNLLSKNKCKKINILVSAPDEEVNIRVDTLLKNIKDSFPNNIKSGIEIFFGLALMQKKWPINHDRLIFTNLMVLYSGDSFQYFKNGKQPDVETVLTSFTIIEWSNNFVTYFKKLKKLKKVIPTIDQFGVHKIRSGHCDIELLKRI